MMPRKGTDSSSRFGSVKDWRMTDSPVADASLHVMSDDLAPSYEQAVHPDEVSRRLSE